MPLSRLDSLKIKAKLLQKAKMRAGKKIALKDAFAILAEKAGYDSWRAMKSALEIHQVLRPKHASALWSTWYGSYAEAKKHWQEHGGFLLPYQKQYFVCDADYILALGIKLDDPILKKVGGNWVEPNDAAAWASLLRKIERQQHDEKSR